MNHPSEAERRADVLISRVVDREDVPEDWEALDRFSIHDPSVVRELWAALRGDASLRQEVRGVSALAGRVDLPSPADAKPRPSDDSGFRGIPFAAWSGWAAALLVGVFAWGWGKAPEDVARERLAGAEPTVVVADSVMVEELPDLVVSAEPARDGEGFDVLVMRRVVEKVRVPELYDIALDEYGWPVRTRVTPAALTQPASF